MGRSSLLLGLCLAMASPGVSQETCPPLPDDPAALARSYAPSLYFAPGERDFPTVPFWRAFAGGSLDDPSKIAAFDESQGSPLRYASWDSLYAPSDGASALPAVLYRVRPLTREDTRELWRFLRKDIQAWRRFDMSRRWPELERERTAFKVIEYYFYYLNDTGLEGHKEDIEFVFVFLPVDPNYTCSFRVTVGAGHDERTPNNVQVRFDEDAKRTDTPVLVELGGHASAPLIDSSNRGFEIGRDVNWHANDVWGTRDIMAVAGLGFSGPYRPEMTFSRDVPGAERSLPPRKLGKLTTGYRLVPVGELERLVEAVAEVPADTASALEALRTLAGPLPFTAPDTLGSEQVRRLRTWSEPLWTHEGKKLGAEKHQIWKHKHYTSSPALILKEHLYRPSVKALTWKEIPSLFTYGIGGTPKDAYEVHAGFVMPVIFTPLSMSGFLEFQAGLAMPRIYNGWSDVRAGSWMFSALYDNDYRGRSGWYTKLTYTPDRGALLGDDARSDLTFSIGPSILLWSYDQKRFHHLRSAMANVLRIRLGPRADLGSFDDLFQRVALEIQLSFRQ